MNVLIEYIVRLCRYYVCDSVTMDTVTIGNERITLSSFTVAIGDKPDCWSGIIPNMDVYRCLGIVLSFK